MLRSTVLVRTWFIAKTVHQRGLPGVEFVALHGSGQDLERNEFDYIRTGVEAAIRALDAILNDDDDPYESLENAVGAPSMSPSPSDSFSSGAAPSSSAAGHHHFQHQVDENTFEEDTNQSYHNRKRRSRRQEAILNEGHPATKRMAFEHIQLATPVESAFDMKDLPAAAGAYCGKNADASTIDRKKAYTLDELQNGYGFTLLPFNQYETVPFVDKAKNLFGLITPGLNTPSYRQDIRNAFEIIQDAEANEQFTDKELDHRRGEYGNVNFGISLGNGQQAPKHLELGSHKGLVSRILGSASFKRIVGFTDSVFANWAPKLYRHYQTTLKEVEDEIQSKRYFPGCCFACATINIGPSVRTFVHRDMKNLAFGWCAITPLGYFDHTKGGHLILWDAKLIVEFPAGSTAYIPSATLRHSNTAIQANETRASFTQYSAGALFRWVDNGYKTDVELQKDSAAFEAVLEIRKQGVEKALAMLPTMKSLTENL